MKQPTVSIIIPLFNEKESLEHLVRQLEKIEVKKWAFTEYVFVDDGSTDDSFEVLKKLIGKTKRKLILIRFRKNLGKSAALSVGFSETQSDYLATLDADLQDEPHEIPLLLEKLDQGSDLVIGWRKNRQDPGTKKFLSQIFNNVVAKLYHVSLHDMNSGLKVLRRI